MSNKARFTFVHPDGSFNPPVQNHHMLQMLGLKSRLPVDGLPSRELVGLDHEQGVTVAVRVWVVPRAPKFGKHWNGHEYVEAPVKTSKHRVRCACPGCGVELSAGRLFQHVCASVAPPSNAGVELVRLS